jgi:predicted phosphodiesterase
MTKIFVLGDTHGNTNSAVGSISRAKAKGADMIIQVGDFGYWEHKRDGVDFLNAVSKAAVKNGLPFIWLDGNHENHTMLRKVYGPGGDKHDPTPEGFWTIRPNLFYSPRANVWEVDGLKFMTLGGAVSIDKEYRLAVEKGVACPEWGFFPEPGGYNRGTGTGTQWWPEENITDADVDLAISRGKVDVLFTHDTVTCAHFGQRLKLDVDSYVNRQKVDRVVKAVKPSMMFHGHYHTLMESSFMQEDGSYTEIWGVECDGMSKNWLMFDTDKVKS